ncbi:MAG: SH3 domain-containing protein, partial [Chloroflexota bacterium]
MRVLRWLAVAISGLLIFSVVVAQDTACPALVEQALQASDKACSDLGRNQICYGNIKAEALDRAGDPLTFKAAGDRVAVQDVSKLVTFPMNVKDKTWGVALLSLQANLPDTLPGQNVSLVAFGDVSLKNEVKADTPPAPSLSAVATGKINIRAGAGTSFDLAGTVQKGDSVTAIGRNEKGDWIQVLFDKGTGWVFASLLRITGDAKTLLPTKGDVAYNAPMQAFTFHDNTSGLKCAEAPENGLLIQSPQHVNVSFRINGIDIKVGSTALIRSAPNNSI